MYLRIVAVAVIVIGLCSSRVCAQASFVNWETPPVYPLDITPNGAHLLAVNTPDNRLEVFSVTDDGLVHAGAVPVGLDPVSVRARSDTEVWVVNHISDSISIVDLETMNVVQTLTTGDEPADVVFAGSPQRAFVTLSQLNQINVYDPADLQAAPSVIVLEGEDPRALATDGSVVYAAIFESGNRSTILSQSVVSSGVNPYPGSANPPPNDGTEFNPPLAPGLPAPPEVSLIVSKSAAGTWLDDNDGDWSAAVGWDLHDHDVAIIDADTLAVSYAGGLMNANMGLCVHPSGTVTVVGTEATNHIRFESNLNGIFVRVVGATISSDGGDAVIVDLNPHLDYTTPSVSQALREQSIGDPRGVTWNASGTQCYITGMGSNNVLVVDGALARVGLIEVGQGPTGILVDDARASVYVLNRFEASVSVVDESTLTEVTRVSFHDPTPEAIRLGRPHLYDTHQTSGLGQASCASCHIDARMDQLAWDLGDPAGSVQEFDLLCNGGVPVGGQCGDWHPMKGPMVTQTLVGIIGTEPLHWRGDRQGLPAFDTAFETLMGDDGPLNETEMSQLLAFVASLTPPPNPFRTFNNALPLSFANGGNPSLGTIFFNSWQLVGGNMNCSACHAPPSGTHGFVISGDFMQVTQDFKIPQFRNLYEKTGFEDSSQNNNRGFGFTHDGSVDTVFEFLNFDGFTFSTDNQRRDVEAFLMCWSTDTHAAIGVQTTVVDAATAPAAQLDLITDMLNLAGGGVVGLVVKGRQDGVQRGYTYLGGDQFQSDRAAEVVAATALLDGAQPGAELTYTVVPAGTQTRLGIDRDEDGFLDRDELDAGSDPADPQSVPCPADLEGDAVVDTVDLAILLGAWGPNPDHPADLDNDGIVEASDLGQLLGAWGPC